MKKILKTDDAFFLSSEIVDYKKMGNVIEVSKLKCKPLKCPVRVLDGYSYVLLDTGEIKRFKINSKGRIDHVNSLYRTFKSIREIINTNVYDVSRVRWVTLTYAENMTDPKRLRKDFEAFNKRLKRYCSKYQLGDYEYINIVEPQARGAWHHHLFLIFDGEAPFIPNSELARIWSFGFVKIKALDDIDNIGAYFSAYLSDVTMDEVEKDEGFTIITDRVEVNKKVIDGQEKRVIKGGRLGYYPKGFRIIRTSQGIKKPVTELVKYEKIKKEGSAKPSRSKTIRVIDKLTGKELNTYRCIQYNISNRN